MPDEEAVLPRRAGRARVETSAVRLRLVVAALLVLAFGMWGLPASAAAAPPAGTVSTPQAEQSFASGAAIAFTGTASSGSAVTSVSLNLRNVSTGQVTTVKAVLATPRKPSTTWSASWTPPVGARYSVRTRVADTAGLVGFSPLTFFKVAAPGPSFLTLLFGRTQLVAAGTTCAPLPNTVPLTEVVQALASRGLRGTGAVIGDRTAEEGTTCTGGALYPSWKQLADMRDLGTTFVSAGTTYLNNALLAPEEQHENICGSLFQLERHGHHRAWGLFAHPDNKGIDAVQAPVASNCFAYGRQYADVPDRQATLAVAPYLQHTRSVTGGACNDPSRACYDMPIVGRSTGTQLRYHSVPALSALMTPGGGEWRTVQTYKFVKGAYRTGETSGPRWDCTSADWRAHYTTIAETYCWNDMLQALSAIRPETRVTDPATVAESWAADAAPPAVELTSRPAEVSTDTSASFAFTASSGRVWTSCSLDGAAFRVCSSGVTHEGLNEGPHRFVVRASDSRGRSVQEEVTWTVVPPVALPALDASPSPVDFGGWALGASSEPRTVTVTNSGGGALVIDTVEVDGESAADFAVQDSCVAVGPLAPGASCEVAVTFSPTVVGSRTASLVLRSNDPDASTAVSLSGEGQEASTP